MITLSFICVLAAFILLALAATIVHERALQLACGAAALIVLALLILPRLSL